MSDGARLWLFALAVVAGALLAWQKVISGDAWLTLVLGLLLPSPLEHKRGGPMAGAGLGAGVASVSAALAPTFFVRPALAFLLCAYAAAYLGAS